MNRRSFLSLIPAALAGATLDPERLLWVPGQKTLFLPSARVAFSTTEVISALKYTYGKDRLLFFASQEVTLWNVLKKAPKPKSCFNLET